MLPVNMVKYQCGSYAMDERRLDLLETVIVTIDLPDEDVLAGDLGAVVEVYTSPELAYEVEFVNPDGTTRALLTIGPGDVRSLAANDVLTTRQVAFAD